MSGVRESLARFKSCVHFTGIQRERCAAGVRYRDVRVEHEPVPLADGRRSFGTSYPCLLNHNHGGATCEKLRAPTDAELDAQAAEIERAFTAIDQGRSPCCDAALDASAVEWTDEGKASGTRYCSKCGKFVDRRCNPGMPGDVDRE